MKRNKFNPRRALLSGGAMLCLTAGAAAADQVIIDDLIVDGSACVGNDCVNGELFSFDTLRLKENNLRIAFVDTSTAANFASNDWTLIANESESGGRDMFAIQDTSGNRQPFVVEAGAGNNALFIEDTGDIGFGTEAPVVRLHMVEGDTPTLRLDQDGSSGFSPQVWDLAGNESNFFLRDASNASRLVFRVRAGAASNSIYVDSDEQIGLGTESPEAALHLRRSNGSAAMLIEETSAGTLGQLTLRNNGITFMTLEDSSIAAGDNTGRSWNFQNQAGTFRVTTAPGGADDIELQLDASGNLYIEGQIFTGTGGTSPTCVAGCDRVFDADYELPSISDHVAEMLDKRHLPAVGPTSETGPFNISQMTGGMLNELEKAHLYIGQLHGEMEAQRADIAMLLEQGRRQQDEIAALRGALQSPSQNGRD